jgi:hypothetical protein
MGWFAIARELVVWSLASLRFEMSAADGKSAGPGKDSLLTSSVSLHLPIHHNSHVSSGVKELHHLLSLSRHFRPSGFCVGILLQPAKVVAVELKIDLLEAALRSVFNRILFAVDLDVLCAVNEGLMPYAD